MERRVVVTGLGVVSPVGNNIDEMWASIKAGKHGIAPITRFDTEGHKVTLAAEVKDFDFGDRRAAKRLDIADQYALVAAREAVADSGIVSGENVESVVNAALEEGSSPRERGKLHPHAWYRSHHRLIPA